MEDKLCKVSTIEKLFSEIFVDSDIQKNTDLMRKFAKTYNIRGDFE